MESDSDEGRSDAMRFDDSGAGGGDGEIDGRMWKMRNHRVHGTQAI